MTAIHILVADDHEIVRKGLVSILGRSHPEWQIVAEAANGTDAIELGQSLRPHVAILDLSMPGPGGLKVAERLIELVPGIRILILTMHDSDHVVREVLRAGARGFLLKSDAGRDLVAAVEALQRQRTFFTTRVSQMLLDGYLDRENQDERAGEDFDDVLTTREREVIQLLAEGKTSKEVAIALNLSVKTAETHRTNLMRKLGLHSVADLTRYAVRNGIVQVF